MRHACWLAVLVAACSTDGADVDDTDDSDGRVAAILALYGDETDGEPVYEEHCESCHLEDGKGLHHDGGGENLAATVPRATDAEVVTVVLDGAGEMGPFDGLLSDQQIADVLAWLRVRF